MIITMAHHYIVYLTVEILLKEGVCANPSNADGLTPLHRVRQINN